MLRQRRRAHRHAEGGFSLIVALVGLVIMTLAAIALMRTVMTSTSIAGNLALQQAASTSADRAIEAAVTWLESNAGLASSTTASACATGSTVLACDQKAHGYSATRTDPSGEQTWSQLWSTLEAAGYAAVSLSADSAENTPAYLIQRMCASAGDASASLGCSASPLGLDTASSRKAGITPLSTSSQVYYRITVKVSGPRDTASIIQVMVAQ